jgi:ATP-dependent phosphoenolpyruvate carboxykinase
VVRFGTVLENVDYDPHTRTVDYDSQRLTENTRASYPIEYIANAHIPCVGGHPKNVILLACDAFGVLPPVSRLTLEQAMYHFISGYTAKVRQINGRVCDDNDVEDSIHSRSSLCVGTRLLVQLGAFVRLVVCILRVAPPSG